MEPSSIALRVAQRYLEAKGWSLLPEFESALKLYSEKGDNGPISEFVQKVIDLTLPNGAPPPWYFALGTARRNTVKWIHDEAKMLLARFRTNHPRTDPERWRAYVVTTLQKWGSKLRTLEIASRAEEKERALNVGGFTVIPMPGLTKAQIGGALDALKEAVEKLQPVFPQVIYGDVYFSSSLQKHVAAWYLYTEDKFYLNVNAKKRFSDVYTIIHELGHRFDGKFLHNTELRNQFWALSMRKEYEKVNFDEKLRKQIAEELLSIAKAQEIGQSAPMLSGIARLWVTSPGTPGNDIRKINTEHIRKQITDEQYIQRVMGTKDIEAQTDQLLHGPLAVTPYGAKAPKENFAEAFAHYVLKMDLPAELSAILDQLK